MSEPDVQPGSASETMRRLKTVHELSVGAAEAESRENFIFRVLNDTVKLASYSRAALWRWRGDAAECLGVSGEPSVNSRSPLVGEWQRLLSCFNDKKTARVLAREDFAAESALWDELNSRVNNCSVLWIPLIVDGEAAGGLWLERWGEAWTEEDIAFLQSLAKGYATAWKFFGLAKEGLRGVSARLAKKKRSFLLVALGVYLLFIHPFRLRVVAPCKVVAKTPVAVSAPLNGVIESVDVVPGKKVKAGDVLFEYDTRVLKEQLEVIFQQVEIIQSQLERARVQAFREPETRSEVQVLKLRLEQEKARQRLAESQMKQLVVCAPVDGVVMARRPHEWRGRAVRLGEKMLTIVDPKQTMLRIWIPEADNINFDFGVKAKAFLNVRPTEGLSVVPAYISHHTETSSSGVLSFVAEADWEGENSSRMGLQGTAVMYGEKVSLAYWLLRKPLAAVRRFFGV